jgi:hypothetical protein
MPKTKAQVVELIMQGTPAIMGEYRMGRCDPIQWRDKATGARKNGFAVRCTLECGNSSIAISEFAPDDLTKAEDWKPKFKKGDQVFCVLTHYEQDRGAITVKGALDLVLPDEATPSAKAGASSVASR